jgi:hypothetical protein
MVIAAMIEEASQAKKMVAPAAPMRQLSRMRALRLIPLLLLALSACSSLPAPYQTYSPGQVPIPPPPPTALVVYGATTTSPEMVPDSGEVEPVPAPAPAPDSAAGGAKGQGVAICYNRLWNGTDQVKDAAVQACGGGNMSPRVTTQNVDLDACPVLTPTKAVFACAPAAGQP